MTHQDAQATFDVATSTIRIDTLFARTLIDPNSIHSLFQYLLLVFWVCLDFDLIVAIPMTQSIVDNIVFGGCHVMIGYKDMSIDLVLLNLQDFGDRFGSFLLCLC